MTAITRTDICRITARISSTSWGGIWCSKWVTPDTRGRKLVYGVSLNDNQLPTALLSMGTALDARVNNPFFGLITGGNLATAQLPLHRLLRPYPEFDTVTRNSLTPGGSSSYNALLMKLSKQFSSGVMLTASTSGRRRSTTSEKPSPARAARRTAFATIRISGSSGPWQRTIYRRAW